jgi:hypothetical protein
MSEHAHETTEQDTAEGHHHGPCGPWGDMHRKMWMYGPMFARMAGKGFRGPFGGRGRGSRAQRWMYENPTDEEIIEFLEEYQRDLEQQIADVRTRIDDIKGRSE